MGSQDAGEGTSGSTVATVAGIVLVAGLLVAALPYVVGFLSGQAEVPVWLGGVGVLLGLAAFYYGIQSYRRRQLVRDTPTSKVRSLAIGTAEVQGQAQPLAEPLVSPLTHTPACMYMFRVREKQPTQSRDSTRDEEWRTVLQIEEEIPFCVDDGTGRVPVNPEGAELVIEVEDRAEAGEGDPPPQALETWFEEHGDSKPFDPTRFLPGPLAEQVQAVQEGDKDPEDVDPLDVVPEASEGGDDPPANLDAGDLFLGSVLSNGEPGSSRTEAAAGTREQGSSGGLLDTVKTVAETGKELYDEVQAARGKRKYMTQSTPNERRFQERVLAVDESTYVFGAAHRFPEADSVENVENLELGDDPTTGQFIVSDHSPSRLLDHELVVASLGLAAGVVFVPYGIVGLLLSAGLV